VPPVDLEQLDHRLAIVERDVAELRDTLTEERIATSKLAAQVSAHETRGQERHAEVLAMFGVLRDDMRVRDARAQKIVIAIIGVLSTAVSALSAGLAR
jgi:hypothetical protein